MASAQDLSDHEAIFEVSYQYLSKIKNFGDLEAFHNCIVALINSDKYYRALQLISEVPEEVHREYPLEKAYVYYKTGKTDLLGQVYHATLNAEGVNEVLLRGMKHVVAQSYYQNGEYDAALELYRGFIANNTVDGEVDLACNERAILAQMGFRSGSAVQPQLHLDASAKTYDIVFNDALLKLATGCCAESLQLLESALAQCTDQNLDSDVSDLELEIAPIKLTISYVHQITGNVSEAIEVLESIDLTNVTDPLVRMLIKNNHKSLQTSSGNPNFVARELDYQHNMHVLRQKLTPSQRRLLVKNHLLLSYQSKSLSKSSKYLTNRFIQQFSLQFSGDITPLIYKVLVTLDITAEDYDATETNAAVAKKLFKFALVKLGELKKENVAQEQLTVVLAAAILLLDVNSRSGVFHQSLQIFRDLQTFEEKSLSPHGSAFGILDGILDGLLASADCRNEFWKSLILKFTEISEETFQSNDILYGLARSVVFHSSLCWKSESKEILNKLHAARPSDVIVRGAIDAETSALLPVESLKSSKPIKDLLSIDVQSLVPARLTNSATRKTVNKVKKLSRKPKFSTHKIYKPDHEFDPLKDLDQERWLPLQLRSNYKPSKKDLKKKSGGHQGAVESSPTPTPVPQIAASKSKQKKKKGKK